MIKFITSAALLLSAATIANAQTTAPNWTATDCASASHTLHTELDNGKVIVMVWVMPCGSCVAPATAAYNAVQNFATTHPGRVLYYLADDYGDASCSALSNWVNTNSIGDASKMSIFDNAGNAINMNGFGSTGMPKVVVMGGSGHTIFFNKNNSAANDATGINAAITSAIDAATSVASLENNISFSVSPNPAADQVTVNYSKAIKKISVTAMNGQLVKEVSYQGGKTNPVLETQQLPAGVYLLKVTDINDETGIQKIIKQ